LAAVTQGVAAVIFWSIRNRARIARDLQCRRTFSFPEWARCAIPPSISILLLPALAATLNRGPQAMLASHSP
jgi:hypothetical protein